MKACVNLFRVILPVTVISRLIQAVANQQPVSSQSAANIFSYVLWLFLICANQIKYIFLAFSSSASCLIKCFFVRGETPAYNFTRNQWCFFWNIVLIIIKGIVWFFRSALTPVIRFKNRTTATTLCGVTFATLATTSTPQDVSSRRESRFVVLLVYDVINAVNQCSPTPRPQTGTGPWVTRCRAAQK